MPHRFYVSNLPDSGNVSLDGTEAHHLMHVLRIGTREVVELFDGRGLVATSEVKALRKRDVELTVVESRREAPPVREVILGTAVPKGDRFDWLIEKATELGVTRIVPLLTSRSSVDPRDSKLDKLRQAVIAACKQSGRNHLLELTGVVPWADFVRNEFPQRTAFIAQPAPLGSPLALAGNSASEQSSLVMAIGPEGGFTDEEVAHAVAAGAKPVSLGPLILRIETAAVALAAALTLR